MDTRTCIHVKLAAMLPKDVGIRIRVERELREAFRSACLAEGQKASDVLRIFMRRYVEEQGLGKQGNLFISTTENNARELLPRVND